MENKVRVFDDLIKIERHKPIFAGGYHDWEIQYNTLNYTEAIEVMAKALYSFHWGCGGRFSMDGTIEDVKEYAKAALNALLQKEK